MEKYLQKKLTIENAAETARILRELLKNQKEPVIDLSGVEKIDLSGIQLLISAQKAGPKLKKTIYYTGKMKESISEKLKGSGFRIVNSSGSTELFTIRRNSSEI